MDLQLTDKVALVTGGGHGLGRAVCLALAAEGVKVGINYRRGAAKAGAVVEEIATTHGTEAIALKGDVAAEADVHDLFETLETRFGPVEILVNNAAVCPTCQVKDMDVATWEETFRVNMTGTFLTSRRMVQRLTELEQTGRIVNVSSQAAFRGSTTGHAPYDASKGSIVSFTVALARELAETGIAVNCVAPGMMYTEMTRDTLDANREKYLARIPLRRIGDPAEIAKVIVFLASPAASYMTGATVDVSGGMLLR